LIRNQVTREILRGINATDNQCPAEIGTLEELNQVGRGVRLPSNDTAHHGDTFGRVDPRAATEALDRLGGLFELALAGEPPGGLGRDEEEDGEGGGEDPGQSGGDSVLLKFGIGTAWAV
jgi:hypothetical protein